MHAPTLYLDSSVIGGYFDEQFAKATRELWRQMEQGRYRFVASTLVAQEILGAPKAVQKLFKQTFSRSGSILAVNDEMEGLAEVYLRQNVVPARYADDAGHVAACVVARLDYLVSWNFNGVPPIWWTVVSLKLDTSERNMLKLHGIQGWGRGPGKRAGSNR